MVPLSPMVSLVPVMGGLFTGDPSGIPFGRLRTEVDPWDWTVFGRFL